MKKTEWIILLFVGTFALGCSEFRLGSSENEIICDLHHAGVTENNTEKMVFVGSEGNFGSVRVEISHDQKIQEVWSMLYRSSPGGVHYSCGGVTIEFYKSFQGSKPDATLIIWCGNDDGIVLVKESKRVMYDEATKKVRNMYKCPGLEKYVMSELEKEYKRINP